MEDEVIKQILDFLEPARPFLSEIGGRLTAKVSEKLEGKFDEEAQKLAIKLWGKIRGKGEPPRTETKEAFKDDLTKLVEQDKSLAEELKKIVIENKGIMAAAIGKESTAIGSMQGGYVAVHGGTINIHPSPDTETSKLSPAASIPRLNQLPADIDDFVGQDKEVDELVTLLSGGDSHAAISAIGGMGGIGKTTLAVHVAHKLTGRYPDAQIVVTMKGTDENPLSPYEAMENVISAFHPDAKLPNEPEAIKQAYYSVLASKRALIILDNAKDTAQVRELVPPKPAALIITSRHTIALPAVHSVDLDILPIEKARELLHLTIGPGKLVKKELGDIAELCGRLPLALRVAGSFLAVNPSWTAAEYIEALKEERKRLSHDDLDVEATLGVSATQLVREDVKLAEQWQMLSVFPASFDRQAVTAVWEMEKDKTRDGLGKLLERSLLFFDEKRRRFRLHDLMRPVAETVFSFTDEKTDEEENKQRLLAASYRHSAYYLALLGFANKLYEKGGDSIIDGLSLFDMERENIITGQKRASINWKYNDNAAGLCNEYPNAGLYILALRLHPRELIQWLESALASARNLKNREYEGYHLGNLGVAYKNLGETKLAIDYHERRLEIARETGDRRGEGNALGNMGNAYRILGETKRAIEHYEQSLVIAREIGDRRGEGNALGSLGIAYRNLGETQHAIEHYEQQLNITREIGDRRGEGNALGSLGIAYRNLGETQRAIEYYEQQLNITREIGDRRGEGATLGNLGNAYADLGETIRALDYYEQSLEIVREIGDRRGEGKALYNKSIALHKLGEREQAIAHAEAALIIYQQIEDPSAEKVRKILAEWRGED